jgi:hypothetical protein
MADRAKFLSFLDMIDGGGAGKVGNEFQGGGILSEIANMIATPYGSEDPRRRAIAMDRNKKRRDALGLLDAIGTKEEQAAAAARAAATPSVVKRSVPEVTSSPRPQLRPAAGRTMDQAVGGAQYPSMYRSMDSVVGGMGLPAAPAGKTMDQAVGGAQYPSMYRSMDSVVGSMGAPDMPLPRVGNQAVPLRTRGAEFYKQPNIAPDYVGDYTRRQDYSTRAPYPSAMSPTAPAMPQGVMSFRDFVDAERAAMSGADRYVDPANYRRGYARYLSSMGINPATMGM